MRGHEHLQQPFLGQLKHRFVESLVAALGGPEGGEVFGRELLDARELDAPIGVERVADSDAPG